MARISNGHHHGHEIDSWNHLIHKPIKRREALKAAFSNFARGGMNLVRALRLPTWKRVSGIVKSGFKMLGRRG